MSDEILTQAKVKELYDYDGNELTRKTTRGGVKAGGKVGSDNGRGYLQGRIDGRFYMVHRLIWLYAHGEWPKGEIDHINGDRGDNRLDNLRVVSRSTNMRNKKKHANNKSGICGVSWHKRDRNWCAFIDQDGKKVWLGSYDCKYRAASIRHFAMEIEGNYTARHGK